MCVCVCVFVCMCVCLCVFVWGIRPAVSVAKKISNGSQHCVLIDGAIPLIVFFIGLPYLLVNY